MSPLSAPASLIYGHIDRLDQAVAKRQDGEENAHAFREFLRTLVCDNGDGTFARMRQRLVTREQEDLPLMDPELRKFYHRINIDVRYLDMIETGGIDALNAYIAQCLETLQLPTDQQAEPARNTVGRINDLMGRAIVLFPNRVTGIEASVQSQRIARDAFFNGKKIILVPLPTPAMPTVSVAPDTQTVHFQIGHGVENTVRLRLEECGSMCFVDHLPLLPSISVEQQEGRTVRTTRQFNHHIDHYLAYRGFVPRPEDATTLRNPDLPKFTATRGLTTNHFLLEEETNTNPRTADTFQGTAVIDRLMRIPPETDRS